MADIADYWNHNVHYRGVIISAVPPGCQPPPGVRYRRHLLWRYSLTWEKPSR
jgi:hypothetical protein